MSLEDLIDVYAAGGGEPAEVPDGLREDFVAARRGFDALQEALGETLTFAEGRDAADRPPPALPPDYEILRELGRGGMGVVYLARQKSLGRDVAVKVLRPGDAVFGRIVRRFLEEARHLARLRHPNIVAIHEVGRAGDEPFFTMDFVEGESLAVTLRRGPLPPTRALAILKQAAEAVDHAHRQGIIHRDLKPANILLQADGRTFVTDFGLARDMTQRSELTRTGEIMGTPAYMAPEQAQGDAGCVGETTDVHALGAILYECLTGQPPYGRDAPALVITRLLQAEPPGFRQIDRRIPRDLETICLKALAKRNEARYATVSAFREDLVRFEGGSPVVARRAGIWQRTQRTFSRNWRPAALLGAGAVMAIVVLTVMAGGNRAGNLMEVASNHAAAERWSPAIESWRQALKYADHDERPAILAGLIRAFARIQDPKTRLEAGILAAEIAPDASLGAADRPVAEALLAKVRSLNGFPWQRPGDEERPLLDLAARRLQILVNTPAAEGDALDADREALAAIRNNLDFDAWRRRMTASQGGRPPPGPGPIRLSTVWDRGMDAYSEARTLDSAGKPEAALDAYQSAWTSMTTVFPIATGMTHGHPFPGLVVEEAAECRILRAVHDAIRRLDPAAAPGLQGGLRIRIEGVPLPKDMTLGFSLRLRAADAPRMFPDDDVAQLPSDIVLKENGTAEVRVADGSYRMRLQDGSKSWISSGPEGARAARLHLDMPVLPEVVVVAGEMIDLPPVQVRLLDAIQLLEPAADALMDLQRDVFRWEPVPDAARYEIEIRRIEKTPTHSTGMTSLRHDSKTPAFFAGTLTSADIDSPDGLPNNTVLGWEVRAFDATGRLVGRTIGEQRKFIVARGLGSK